MDPLSIATGCATLISTIGSLSLSINSFVRTCRESRGDLDRVARELLSLQTVLELIHEDVTDESKAFPTTLEHHVSGIIMNCNSVVVELQECITKYSVDSRLKTKAGWAINGQGDVAKLRSNLEAHKAALELALDMLSLHITKEIKNDTSEIRNETSAIKDDTAQILEEILRLQKRLPKQGGNDYILQTFLEEMTTYTEKALDGASIDEGDSSTKAASFVLETDEGSQRPSDPAYLSDWELDSAASDPASYKLKKRRWEKQQHEERLAEAKLKDAQRSLQSPQQQPIAFRHSGHWEPSEEDDDLGPVPPKDANIEEWKRSSVESENEWWEKKNKERQDRKSQLYSGGDHHLITSAHLTSSREHSQGTTETHDSHGARVPGKKKSQSSPAEASDVARKRYFKPDPANHDSDNEYSHDYEKEESEVANYLSRKATKAERIPLSASAVVSSTPDFHYLEVETFHGRLLINWPMPTSVTDLLSEDYYIESSCNSFTALTCLAQDFRFQKDTLRPRRFLKPRDIKLVFYIPVTTETTSSCFKRQWEFITTAVTGLTRRLELGGDVPPPWHNIIIVVEGPPRWDGIDPEIEIILTELGILYKTESLVSKVDGVPLDPPYHKDHCKVSGKMIHGTIHEYTVQPTIRPQHACTKNIMGTEPLQVIAVAPQLSLTDWASHKPALSANWAAAVCEVLRPEFIMSLPERQIRAIPSPGEFLKGVWTCETRFRMSKHKQINQCVLTSPDQFQADRKKMVTQAEGARGFARRLFGKS
ncbi:uncharacterized protein FFUJ_12434 [Fusarium fujikuroi IMI 58289]|uniref:Azaphilone pigments biosynthesis cluster protein L N-terminal domain-containing protein n=2 Tax=Fusarium fujikuroi TaxID=5127 RepID=S0EC99_GIBF5|nr:uncharacterized protein FFUJ_12434 [Fusarium fujikuroi IMI 58289]KLP22171.1 uncharacterized protein LW94_5347 [Fusarium fujikuroi]CCT72556.1 uncharacterized protein FFUJ_12434 [Fusarium fujikuroi IMI 58289]SCO23024.1 uncharacterized protein FFM5_13191 [Fusarium fujikuroi]VTT64820.1 unnamed protein product [Fusarium fujikuroi]